MFFIRADGNENIGAGHLMRCLTVGTELIKLTAGEEVVFLCADGKSGALAARQGFRTLVLGTDYRDMASELPALERIFGGLREDSKEEGAAPGQSARPVILVDSYCVTDEYLEGLRRFGTVALMDDMGKKRHPADAVINYNLTADAAVYERYYRGTGTRLLLGSAYVPVREQFLNRGYQVKAAAKTVLITTGGGDSENIAGRLLRALWEEGREYHLVAGRFNPHFQALRQMEEEHGNIRLHCDVADMAGLMAAADIAVTAGGSTIYELAVLGVPFICFSCAENQEPLTEYIGAHRIAGFGGAFHRSPGEAAERVGSLFRELASDENLRRRYHDNEKRLVDGYGAKRLAEALIRINKSERKEAAQK